MSDGSKLQRSLWLTPRLLHDRVGSAAHQRAEGLGRGVHEEILVTGDRLAAVSVALAQRYYRRAAAARVRFGADGFARWVALGEDLATVEPVCREGAMAFFSVSVSTFGAGGPETATEWWRLARTVAETSRKLAGIFLKTTPLVLKQVGGLTRLRAWVAVGLQLYRQRGWQGEFLAQAYFAAAPRAVLTLSADLYQVWAGTGAAMYPVMKEREFFGSLARELHGWPASERATFLRTTLTLATSSPKHAALFYRELPAALRLLRARVRAALLPVLARAAKQPAALAELAPIVGALLQQVPAAHVEEALTLVDAVAQRFPEVTAACVKSLPQVYEEAPPAQVREWFATGLTLVLDNVAARMAFFALESRTSVKVLRACATAVTLEEAQGVLRKYIQMLSGTSASVRGVGEVRLCPTLEEFPAEHEVALPLRLDLLDTHEDNFRVYCFLAAQLAGRREFGTYAFIPPGDEADPDESPGRALFRYLSHPDRPEMLEDLFLLTEGARVFFRLRAAYSGMAAEGRWLGTRVLGRAQGHAGGGRAQVVDALLALIFTGLADLPEGVEVVPGDVAALVVRLTAPLAAPAATVEDSMRVAHALALRLALVTRDRSHAELSGDALLLERVAGETMMESYADDEPLAGGGEAPRVPSLSRPSDEGVLPDDVELKLSPDPDEGRGGSQTISADELRRLLESGVNLKISQAAGEDVDGVGLYITDLVGKIPSEQLEELRRLLADGEERSGRVPRRWLSGATTNPSFFYDEWDYHIGDYRTRWCQLHEITLDPDAGEFYHQALTDYARLIPEVRRQFQRIRPEMYRTVRGLEDGEDFDLNAVINALVEGRAGRPPSSKLYMARKREERDVATLFLVDMSASTDEPLVPAERSATVVDHSRVPAASTRAQPARVKRIIDVTKAALVIMAAALEEIGDAYAIYGFSGHGREQVEFYRVKSFAEGLNPTVKGRVGGIEPKRSTRMGTALRHAVEKMAAVNSRSKHLFLLSDGFPQDYDYGQDRRSNVYGIRDTAVALREAESAGITPFCITVDKAGHDYLRQMCDASRYMVIEDIEELPRELPKIYQRIVRA